jgi:protein-S-isoprenylcysteine O-methyltransferase Ste14
VTLALRSLLWTVLFPGVVAGYVPWRFFGVGAAARAEPSAVGVVGWVVIAAGAALLAACIVEFAMSGRGTLSPADPPRELVVRGLYRYVRNPMYLAVGTILLGEVLITRSLALALYAGAFFVAANVFVMGYEEPWLRRRFGASYEAYAGSVQRWLPRRPRG